MNPAAALPDHRLFCCRRCNHSFPLFGVYPLAGPVSYLFCPTCFCNYTLTIHSPPPETNPSRRLLPILSFVVTDADLSPIVHVAPVPNSEDRGNGRRSFPASESAVDALPVVKIDRSVLKAVQNTTCSICMDEYEIGDEANRLPCRHLFHRRCIRRWLHRKNTCPLCRHNLPEAAGERETPRRGGDPPAGTAPARLEGLAVFPGGFAEVQSQSVRVYMRRHDFQQGLVGVDWCHIDAMAGSMAVMMSPMAGVFFLLNDTNLSLHLSMAIISLSTGAITSLSVSATTELFGAKNFGIYHNILVTNIPIESFLFGDFEALIYHREAGRGDRKCMGAECFRMGRIMWALLCSFGTFLAMILHARN